MTARENRGGPRAPDGVPRPASLPLARGPNRSDMSELPGSPGTPLPPGPGEATVQQGQAGPARKALNGIPLPQITNSQGNLNDDTMAPDEPLTAGITMGPGAGPESLIPSQGGLTSRLTAEQMQYAYPLIMRLATLPNATSETKIMAQRIRASLPVSPEQMPVMEPSDRGIPG